MITAGTASAKTSSGTVNGAGSTFVAPLVNKWMGPVQSQLGITLNYNPNGSTGGVQAITTHEADFGASDAPLSQFNPTCTTCVQIPWALAATAVIYNVGHGSLQHLKMTGPVLAQIYLGKITKWNAPAIKKLNKGKNLPSTSITVVHRSDGSGTTFNFTDYLSHVSHTWKSQVGTGTSVNWPTGEGEGHSSGVAGTVKSTDGAIGYVDVDYAVVNHLGIMVMKNRAGNFVQPRAAGIKAAAALDTHPAKDGSLSIVNPPASHKYRNAYPICTYTYVDVQRASGANTANIKRLISWAVTKGQSYGPPIIFEPLPKAVVTFDKKQIKKIHS
ncbi:MAG TPA: phosphate ABC transporter substrate-binding protein PstS [Gaiellaceae bacterium]|nr:phosphate ABC transporter substrate-binding protein PstS [Gaiellaceae bacterium]